METWFKKFRSWLFILYGGISSENMQVSMFPLMLLFTHAFLNIFYWDIVFCVEDSMRNILVVARVKGYTDRSPL